MPTTLTLKNMPDEVYQRLKASAKANRRSLNSEAIVCLERMLQAQPPDATGRLERARNLRARLSSGAFPDGVNAPDLDTVKREGRP